MKIISNEGSWRTRETRERVGGIKNPRKLCLCPQWLDEMRACEAVCVCVREREREKEKDEAEKYFSLHVGKTGEGPKITKMPIGFKIIFKPSGGYCPYHLS